MIIEASAKRKIGDLTIFDDANRLNDPIEWEKQYDLLMDQKQRGGTSYKATSLIGVQTNEDVQYCPISKGFSQQDVSSFTLGPIVGRGLCLVNAAFSVTICTCHLQGGKFDPKSKNFWRKFRSPERIVRKINDKFMMVDNLVVNIKDWLAQNTSLWFEQWELWRKAIAMCSRGDFHWCDDLGETLCYKLNDEYIDFVKWKKLCYIGPSYQLLPQTKVFQFLKKLYDSKIPIGLVHPKAITDAPETPFTTSQIRELYDSTDVLCCQPFIVAGLLMGVTINPQ